VVKTPARSVPTPTPAELEILAVLWRLGEATVRQVHGVLDERRATGYTTVLKLMQIMTAKGLVERDETARAHVYRAAAKQDDLCGRLVDDLLDRAFGGSAAQLVLQALSRRRASKKDLKEIRRMLDEYEGGRK
jgi:BlaI family transcriptional regulator, penicillinase repressor